MSSQSILFFSPDLSADRQVAVEILPIFFREIATNSGISSLKKLFHYNSKDYGIKQFINVPESFLIYKLLRKFAEIFTNTNIL
jgi:hypothetical protein